MLLGMKESCKKGESESILALSLAAGIAKSQSKCSQRYRWAGLLSRPLIKAGDCISSASSVFLVNCSRAKRTSAERGTAIASCSRYSAGLAIGHGQKCESGLRHNL